MMEIGNEQTPAKMRLRIGLLKILDQPIMSELCLENAQENTAVNLAIINGREKIG